MKSTSCKMEKPWLLIVMLLLPSMTVISSFSVEAFHPIHTSPCSTRYTRTVPTKSLRKYVVDSTRRNHNKIIRNQSNHQNHDDTLALDVAIEMGLSDSISDRTTGNSSSNSGSSWSVTDNWNRLSQSDNINYNYGSNDNDTGEIVVLNSIDQVTLAALRMQNFGMSTSSTPLTEEEIWIQDSIQQIMVVDEDAESNDTATTNMKSKNELETIDAITSSVTLNTEQFLDDMGKEIAMLVRCNENSQNVNFDTKTSAFLFMDECEILDDSEFAASTMTDKQGKSSYERVELYNGTPIWMKDGEFGKCLLCLQLSFLDSALFLLCLYNSKSLTMSVPNTSI